MQCKYFLEHFHIHFTCPPTVVSCNQYSREWHLGWYVDPAIWWKANSFVVCVAVNYCYVHVMCNNRAQIYYLKVYVLLITCQADVYILCWLLKYWESCFCPPFFSLLNFICILISSTSRYVHAHWSCSCFPVWKFNGTPTKPRLSVFCSNKQLYAMLVDDQNKKTLFYASTSQKSICGEPRCSKMVSTSALICRIISRSLKCSICIIHLSFLLHSCLLKSMMVCSKFQFPTIVILISC